jgi:hypothetical protein
MQPQPSRISPQSEYRSATQGYAQIPNSVIENQSLFPPAELRLVLIVCRRGENTVSDEHWTKWTGLDKRVKDMAIRGLREKGLRVTGRGDRAKYSFDRNACDSWVRAQSLRHRARTAGRKPSAPSVTAKPNMQVHPECRERGCGRLCESAVIPFPAPQVEKPVSQTELEKPVKTGKNPEPPDERRATEDHSDIGASRPTREAPDFEKPFSQTSSQSKENKQPQNFTLTLEAIRRYFPHVGPEFVEKLRVACIQFGVRDYTDAQLASAVHAARKDRRNQETEGLFLHTVPPRLAAAKKNLTYLTDKERREVLMARKVMKQPENWPEDAVQQSRDILAKYGG